jgi:hypothetical protein
MGANTSTWPSNITFGCKGDKDSCSRKNGMVGDIRQPVALGLAGVASFPDSNSERPVRYSTSCIGMMNEYT